MVSGTADRVSGHVALVPRKRGSQWYIRWRYNDRPGQRRLGPAWHERGRPPAGWYTRRTADQALQAFLTDLRRGMNVPSQTAAATFEEACAEWLRHCEYDRRLRKSTMSDYRRSVRAHLLPAFGASTPLDQITTAKIDAWSAGLLGAGTSKRTAAKLLVNLHGVFRRAQRLYGLTDNPVDGADKIKQQRSGEFRVLTAAEVFALSRAAADPQDAALFLVAAFTGLRLGELRALRWRDIDFSKRLVHVRQSYVAGEWGLPKSGRVRSVPLIDQAATEFERLSRRPNFTQQDDLVFPNSVGSPLDDSRLRRRFTIAVAKAGISRLRFHDLRHTFGTLAVQAWPLSTVQAFLGHAAIETTMIYVHHTPQIDAAEQLSRVVSLSLSPPSDERTRDRSDLSLLPR